MLDPNNPRLMQCVCGVTVEDFGSWRVEWFTGEAHSCRYNAASMLDGLTEDALAGDENLDEMVSAAADLWLRS